MTAHQFDPATSYCHGCGMAAQTLRNLARKPAAADCPAHYARLSDCAGRVVDVAVRADETLALAINGTLAIVLGPEAMFGLRDAIDEGVRSIRERKA